MSNPAVKYPKPNKKNGTPPPSNNGQTPSSSNNNGNESYWKGVLFFIVSILLVVFAFYALKNQDGVAKEISLPELSKLLDDHQIKSISFVREINTGQAFFEGKYDLPPNPVSPSEAKTIGTFHTYVDTEFNKDWPGFLASKGFPVSVVDEKPLNNWLPQTIMSFFPICIILLALYFLFRQQIKMAGKSAFSFGKSKAKMMSRDKNKITFKDVAGIEEAKEEVFEIVEFLKAPKKFQRLGGHIPKGVLMVGPPGTGKTLLAKAIAGEADVPFFSISGSDFVEMFVGVGASRVRDMFEQGKKHAPCIIFIDEIDAVGRSRGTGMGGGHDEREQTLNALLVEMDGIETTEGIIMVAATNRKDVLDPALLRPGRFDREVVVNLPDIKGREQILNVHVQKVKLSKGVDLHTVARGTPGFSGAELANLINEAALIAAKHNKEGIEQPDLEEARDKVRWGRERRSMAMSEKEKKNTAYHEAGHALLNVLLEHTDPLHKVTIIPRGPSLGVTMFLPEQDKLSARKHELIDSLCVTMGGRVAEEIFLGDVTSGASGDIFQATARARKMVCEWGMSDKLGMVRYSDDSNMVFLGRDLGGSRGYSESIAKEIDEEVHDFIHSSYLRAQQLITAHKEALKTIAEALLEYETLDGSQVEDIVKFGKMRNPPPKNIPPPVLPTPSEPLPVNPHPNEKEDDTGLLPGLQGAPAGA